MNHSTPSLPVHHQLPKSTQTHIHWVGDAIQPFHPLSSLLLLPSICPSIRVFSNESDLFIWSPKYYNSSFNISLSNAHPELISFRMDWLDLLAVQGTLKSLLQHHSSKASILQCSAFFIVQLSHLYMTTGKTIAWTRQTFVDKVMSLLFNMVSRLVITFLPRSKRLLFSWLQSPSAVILEPRKIKSATVFTVSPSISHEVMGPDAMISVFWILSFKPTFSLSSFTFIKRLFSSSSLSSIRVVSSSMIFCNWVFWMLHLKMEHHMEKEERLPCLCPYSSLSRFWVPCEPLDCSPPGSSIHVLLQERILEWVDIPFSRGSFWPGYQTQVSCIGRQILYHLSHQGSLKIALGRLIEVRKAE